MDPAGAYYLGCTALLFLVFAGIVARTLSPKQKAKGERAKFRMMDDD